MHCKYCCLYKPLALPADYKVYRKRLCEGVPALTETGCVMRHLCHLVLCAVVFLAPSLLRAAPALPPAAIAKVCSAIVYDLDHEAILFEQNPDERIAPASLTKVMSMFLALDYVQNGHASLTEAVEISPAAAAETGSRMGLRPAEHVPFGKLLYGMAVSSGNDASYAVAERVGGSADAFVRMMNARAAQIGMRDTHFTNPNGLPHPEQYTTARDMLTLGRAYLLAHPSALEYHNTLVMEHRGLRTWNKNPLIGQYPGADGLKTGWVRASGYNIIFTATRNGRRLMAVILGAPDTYLRGAEACRLLDAGFLVCENNAVSIAAALDLLPLDLTRIDPLKTGRENGLLKRKATASRSVSGKPVLNAGRGGKYSIREARKMLAKKNARIVQRVKAAKAQPRPRIHAEKRNVRTSRS